MLGISELGFGFVAVLHADFDRLGKASKFRSGTRLSESDSINFRLFGIGTDLWSLIAVSDVDNTVADSIGAKYIPMCHHALI